MFGEWSSWLITLIGITFTGLAIKCMDDYLDIEYDQCVGRHTVAAKLGKATLPYSLLFLGIGIFIAKEIGLVLFLASYAAGMGHDLLEKMPTGLKGWAEGVFVFVIGILLSGPILMIWGFLIICTIQFLDDLMDIYKDSQSGQRNSAIKLGIVEATMLTVICLLAAVLISPSSSILVLLATPLVHIILELAGGN